MLISDILKLPGEVTADLPHELISRIAGHRETPYTVEGITVKVFAQIESDADGKWGREIGAVYCGDAAAAVYLRRGKWGDDYEVLVADRDAYAALYHKLLAFSPDFDPDGPDIQAHLREQDIHMLIQAGIVDSRPPPTSARDYGHLFQVIQLRAAAAGAEISVFGDVGSGLIAYPRSVAEAAVAGLANVRSRPYAGEVVPDAVHLEIVGDGRESAAGDLPEGS